MMFKSCAHLLNVTAAKFIERAIRKRHDKQHESFHKKEAIKNKNTACFEDQFQKN